MVCFECGVIRAASAARDMNARSGPAWDRHRQALAALKSIERPETERG